MIPCKSQQFWRCLNWQFFEHPSGLTCRDVIHKDDFNALPLCSLFGCHSQVTKLCMKVRPTWFWHQPHCMQGHHTSNLCCCNKHEICTKCNATHLFWTIFFYLLSLIWVWFNVYMWAFYCIFNAASFLFLCNMFQEWQGQEWQGLCPCNTPCQQSGWKPKQGDTVMGNTTTPTPKRTSPTGGTHTITTDKNT